MMSTGAERLISLQIGYCGSGEKPGISFDDIDDLLDGRGEARLTLGVAEQSPALDV